MKKICIFTLYSNIGASSNYRILQFEEKLNNRFQIKKFAFWSDKYITKYIRNKKKYSLSIGILYLWSVVKRVFQIVYYGFSSDIVFFQKGCIPKLNARIVGLLKKHGTKIVFDVDDSIYLDYFDASDQIASYADLVICGNSTLKLHYELLSNNCVILPTVDKTDEYKKYHSNTYSNKIIGWLGSGASIDNLDILIEPMKILCDKHPEIRLIIISDTPSNYLRLIPNSKFVKWDKSTYLSELSQISIGIMPLKNTEYNRGKCGFKIVQYLNMEKPVIVSDVGVNSEIVGNCGLVLKDKKEWVDAIERLLYIDKDYEQCVQSIKKDFYNNYSYEMISDRLIQMLDTL